MDISVIIITLNEEHNIYDCLKSVEWANEIILIDSRSKDKTIEIAKEFRCKIETRKWTGFADQKKYALGKTRNEWVLSIDADERVTDKLKNEIQNLKTSDDIKGYFIKRDNYFLGKKISYCGWDKDFQMRLFKKSFTKVTDRLVHEGFVVNGETSSLSGKMNHFTHKNLTATFNKINQYSSLEAEEQKNKKIPSITAIILHTFSAFFRYFVSLKGYKDGMQGFMVSAANAVTTLQTYMKIWEIKTITNRERNH